MLSFRYGVPLAVVSAMARSYPVEARPAIVAAAIEMAPKELRDLFAAMLVDLDWTRGMIVSPRRALHERTGLRKRDLDRAIRALAAAELIMVRPMTCPRRFAVPALIFAAARVAP